MQPDRSGTISDIQVVWTPVQRARLGICLRADGWTKETASTHPLGMAPRFAFAVRQPAHTSANLTSGNMCGSTRFAKSTVAATSFG
jgi:hypothetical protein